MFTAQNPLRIRTFIVLVAISLTSAACLPASGRPNAATANDTPEELASAEPDAISSPAPPLENANSATRDGEAAGEATTTVDAAEGATDGTTGSETSQGTTEPTTASETIDSVNAGGTVTAPPATSAAQPKGPIRAAFFYPWFPNAWKQGGVEPFTNFTPSLGRYASDDAATIRDQLAMASDAHIDAMIASWWGPDHHTDKAFPALLDATTSAGSTDPSMRWAVYYEEEGQSDPNASTIVQDLNYLNTNYFDNPAYLRVNGAPVVFVWAEPSDGADMAARWAAAKEQFGPDVYVVLKAFSGYGSVTGQPDSWHQYGPAKSYDAQLPYSATVSPGFWLKGEASRLDRDPARFEADVKRMNNSGAFWQLITSWNEWGEGTSVEPATEFGMTYLDILADNPPIGQATNERSDPTPTTTPTTTSPTSSTSAALPAPTPSATAEEPTIQPTVTNSASFTFTAGGDHGKTSGSDATLGMIGDLSPRFHLALGDISYSNTPSEAAWCDYAKSHVGSTPIQLVVGNHEDDDHVDGFIGDFAACLPDRMNSTGVYGAEYYFDVDGLARVIMIGAGNDVDGVKYDYDTPERYAWLENAIDGARQDGLPWVIVGMHKVCITAGQKSCEVTPELLDLLLEKKVDLILQGHDHTYQRSKQLTCATPNRYLPECVADGDDAYKKGAGSVWVVSGLMGGGGMYEINANDSEIGYLTDWMGGNTAQPGRGFSKISVSANQMAVEFVGATTSYSDRFTVTR